MIINQSNDKSTAVLENLKRVREKAENALISCGRSWDNLRLMAVTKTVPPELVNQVIDEGIDLIGENRVQEFLSKAEQYHSAEVHFIGHLQTNKVKQIIDKVSMIESVSSIKLAEEIDRCAKKAGIQMQGLLEINLGYEESKSGFFPDELPQALEKLSTLSNLSLKGMMCIPPRDQSERYFALAEQLFVDTKEKNIDNITMDILSMGMSADYELAIRYGSNLVRLGTVLFGVRN